MKFVLTTRKFQEIIQRQLFIRILEKKQTNKTEKQKKGG